VLAIHERVNQAEWDVVCGDVETHYRLGRYVEGSRAAVAGVARPLGQHFPASIGGAHELPQQPVLF
jgi:uncharacterized membrane protein